MEDNERIKQAIQTAIVAEYGSLHPASAEDFVARLADLFIGLAAETNYQQTEDLMRVTRLVVYTGPVAAVVKQVAASLHGVRLGMRVGDHSQRHCVISAQTLTTDIIEAPKKATST